MEKGTFRYQNRKYHTVLNFEDNGNIYYVVKYYGVYRQWWHYEIMSEYEYVHHLKTDKREK